MLWGNGADETFTDIVMGIRFPRAMAAAILGGGLALSGYLLQTFFHNPIAGPFTLGISSGAKLVVALVMVASLGNALHLSSWVMIMAAFVGSMICMGFVILMSKVTDQMSMLIVSGVMIGYICSAITDFVAQLAEQLICNQQVIGSSPIIGFLLKSKKWVDSRVAKGDRL